MDNMLFMKTFDFIKEEVKKILASSRGSHDWDHTERVLNVSLHIAEKEGADKEIVTLAAILHDIGRGDEFNSAGTLCHAEIGAEMAMNILKKCGLENEKINKIVHCIETHRFRNKKKPLSLEAKVIYDADKLDSIGAVGIGRAFLFAGEVGARLHDKNVDIEKTKAYSKDDTAYREYIAKLQYIKNSILTNEGMKIAKQRNKFMQDFFIRLNKEVDGLL